MVNRRFKCLLLLRFAPDLSLVSVYGQLDRVKARSVVLLYVFACYFFADSRISPQALKLGCIHKTNSFDLITNRISLVSKFTFITVKTFRMRKSQVSISIHDKGQLKSG